MSFPSHVELNGVSFRVEPRTPEQTRRPWREFTVPAILRQPELVGTSRPAKTSRPEVLTYVIDDWNGGEGQKFLDTSFEDTDLMYFKSDGPVNVSEPGQLELGLKATLDTGLGTSGVFAVDGERGPFLGLLEGDVWVAYSRSTSPEVRSFEETASGFPGTWTDRSIVSSGKLTGPPTALGPYWYFTRDATGQIRQSSSGSTTMSSTTARTPFAGDNRLYFGRSVGATYVMKRYNLDDTGSSPASEEEVYTARGVSQGAGTVGVGPSIWSLTADTTEPRLHLFDGDVGLEKYPLPKGFRVYLSSAGFAFRPMAVMNNIIFVGGWIVGAGNAVAPNIPCLVFATDDAPGILALIRPDTSDKITAIQATAANELLLGTENGVVYRYDLESNAISQYIDFGGGKKVSDFTYNNGFYYIATVDGSGDGRIYKTSVAHAAADIYPSSVTVFQSIWDFGYPQEEKILLEVEVFTEELETGESVEVQLVLDDDESGIITTDVDGATMSHATVGGTRSVFTLSGLKASDETIVTRGAHYVEPRVILKSNGDTTPTVYSVTIRAIGGEYVRMLEMDLDISDQTAQRRGRFQLSGQKLADHLRSLRDASPKALIKVEPHFQVRGAPGDSHGADPFAGFLESVEFDLDQNGEGRATVLLRLAEA